MKKMKKTARARYQEKQKKKGKKQLKDIWKMTQIIGLNHPFHEDHVFKPDIWKTLYFCKFCGARRSYV